MATYNNIKKIKIGDNIFNLYDSGNSGGTITSVKTTAGAHTTINVTSGAANFNVPTKTSHLTNDSGFLTAHQTYTSFTGKPTANQTPSFGSTFTISQISQSTSGQVSGTDRTITIPSTIATNTAVGLVKPWYTHTAASTGPTTGNNTTAVAVNAISTTSGKYYAVEADSNGRLFVNVPWTDHTYTVPTITLNGSATTSPSFYAPTGAGTSGYYLKSNGSGAPTWKAFPTIPTITDTYSSTSSNGMSGKAVASALGGYLPLSGGTLTGSLTISSGNIILSNTGVLYAKDTDGTTNRSLIYLSNDNNVAVGYGLYSANKSDTRIYGYNGIELYSNGSITAHGKMVASNFNVSGHNYNIGEDVANISDAAHSWSSSTSWTSLDTVNLTPGTYILIGCIHYPSNTNGRRGVQWYNETDSSAIGASNVLVEHTSGECRLQTVTVVKTSSNIKYRLRGLQNSGSNLSIQSYVRVYAIA